MRSRRKSRLSAGLTRQEELWLIHGLRWLKENPFDDRASEHRAWQLHGERLASTYRLPPGCKPRAWWVFDSNTNRASLPDRGYFVTPVEELGFRLQAGLITELEAAQIERHYAVLNPSETAFCNALAASQQIQDLRLSADALHHLLQDAEIAQRWHSWRNRPEHADKFRALASVMRALIEETQTEERIFS